MVSSKAPSGGEPSLTRPTASDAKPVRARRGPVPGAKAPLFNLSNALGFEVSLTETCHAGRGALVVFLGRGGDGRREETLRSLEDSVGRLRAAQVATLAIGVLSPSTSLAMTTSGRLTFDILCDKDGLVHDGYRLDATAMNDLTIFSIDSSTTVRLAISARTGERITPKTIDVLLESLKEDDLPTA